MSREPHASTPRRTAVSTEAMLRSHRLGQRDATRVEELDEAACELLPGRLGAWLASGLPLGGDDGGEHGGGGGEAEGDEDDEDDEATRTRTTLTDRRPLSQPGSCVAGEGARRLYVIVRLQPCDCYHWAERLSLGRNGVCAALRRQA